MIYLVYTVHVLVSLFLILVVLLQQGKGADLSVFGGGATQAAFGARGAVSLLHKLTVWGFVAFIVTTVSIGFMTAAAKNRSVMSGVPTEESAPAAVSEGDEDAETAPIVPEETGATDPEAAGEATQGDGEEADSDAEGEGSGEGTGSDGDDGSG